MLFDTQLVTIGPKLVKTIVLAIFFGLGFVWFGFLLVHMPYLRPPLNFQGEEHAFRYKICHFTAKIA